MESRVTSLPSQFNLFQKTIDRALAERSEAFLNSVTLPSEVDLAPAYRSALTGGKRFRALCCAIGAASMLGEQRALTAEQLFEESTKDQALIALCCALEFYQASALVHDDLLDGSDTRRGAPSAHVLFETEHERQRLLGDVTSFGRDGAVLLGNLLSAAAENALGDAIEGVRNGGSILRTYSLMTGEVAAGQAADTSATYVPIHLFGSQGATQALEVVKHKAARYSAMYPAILGALLFGGEPSLTELLGAILEPAGIAFQLRDDALGAFGEDALTGKPTGLDIIEGKRTVLLAVALQNASEGDKHELGGIYERSDKSSEDIARAIELLGNYGQREHEQLIGQYKQRALNALEDSGLSVGSQELLGSLVDLLIYRSA